MFADAVLIKSYTFVRLCFFVFFLVASMSQNVFSQEKKSADELLESMAGALRNSTDVPASVYGKLLSIESTLSSEQIEKFYLMRSYLLAAKGKHAERIELNKGFIGRVSNPDVLAKFLYDLSDSYTIKGEYGDALRVMNENILLLPRLSNLNAKISVLQSAITLLGSLSAFDDAMEYANRMYMLNSDSSDMSAKCYGLGNRINIHFLRKESSNAKLLVADAIRRCSDPKTAHMVLIIKVFVVVNLVDSENYAEGLREGEALLQTFTKANESADYMINLSESIARAYWKTGNLVLAERHALKAYQQAKSSGAFQLMEKTSETLAVIKRAQDQLEKALEYYDVNLALKKKVLDDQIQKNLAYQRVKFDTQDKTNQLVLAEQKNKTLIVEKALQQGRNQNLLLFITLGLILLAVLGAWLARTWQQKNLFRTSSQTDGLTQVSNRAHFMACATHAFKDVRNEVSVVLFDMDFFKKINDAFGHAAGDWVLKTVCDVVKAQLLKSDVLGRLGGEEFAICLVGMTPEEVLALAERCRVAIAAVDTTPSGFIFDLSASFGIATRPAHALSPFEEVLAAADKALYLSKNEGRNRVSFHR
jgi:diguanylate cyclase (GGDEF)-like protein